jgi:hypothetical protein
LTSTITAAEIAADLTTHHHANATTGPAWQPGYRTHQASPRTVRLWHDGPDEADHLDQYTETLRAVGYTVIPEPGTDSRRPTLRITRP